MNKEIIDEREFELINIIGAQLGSNQRDLSKHLALSLGQTNMLIRRLVSKGYIRITQLNKRKVQYLLTPKGFAEKMQKSVKYTVKTINSIWSIKESIKRILNRLYAKGCRNFVVIGKSDFALLIEMVVKDMKLKDYNITYINDIPREEIQGAVLVCRENVALKDVRALEVVDLIHELAKEEVFLQGSHAN